MNGEYGTKVFLTDHIKELDRQTLVMENISESDLILRAARALYKTISSLYPLSPSQAGSPSKRGVCILCGPGNNGNDGRALSTLLTEAGYDVNIFNFPQDDVPSLSAHSNDTLIIDALFGSGLTRPLEGVAAAWVRSINKTKGIRIAIDIPSGLHGETNDVSEEFVAVQAHHTLSLEFPKLSFFFPESANHAGNWQVVPFGLSTQAVAAAETPYRMVNPEKLKPLLKPLPKFLHKGTAGRIRLLAGSRGMMGAAALAVQAAYRTGAGWVQALVPEREMGLLQVMVPEAIVEGVEEWVRRVNGVEWADGVQGADDGGQWANTRVRPYDDGAFGAGPGMGISDMAVENLRVLLHQCADGDREGRPYGVLDADALNILALHPELWQHVPKNTIITPHPGEFKRLAGAWKNDFQRLQLQRQFAAKHNVIVVLKGAHTSTAFPDGTVYFNTSGNPGMATAGSGDVLTGILLGLLAQGLPRQESAILGVYLHGVAGDLSAETLGQRSVIASDMVKKISFAMQRF